MHENDFYRKVSGILGIETELSPFPYRYRTRWNNRDPGRGRFEGFGIVRQFGDQVQVALTAPHAVSRIFASTEEALAFLENMIADVAHHA